jgi:hypothetical protein
MPHRVSIKNITLFALMVLLLLPIATCGTGEDPEGTRVLTALVPLRYEIIFREAAKNMPDDFRLDITTWGGLDFPADRMRTMFMGGQGYDIIFMKKDMQQLDAFPYWTNALSGLFANIYELIERDPFTGIDDYYANVFKAWEVGGGLYGIPLLFGFEYIGVNLNMPQDFIDRFKQYETISYIELLRLYLDFARDNDGWAMGDTSLLFHPINIASAAMTDFINIDNRTANFENDRFIEILDDINNLPLHNAQRGVAEALEQRGRLMAVMIPQDLIRERATHHVFMADRYFLNPANALLTPVTPYFSHHIPVTDCHGRLRHSYNTGIICIGAAADGDLAWEFTKSLILTVADFTPNAPIGFNYTKHQLSSPIQREYFTYHITSGFYMATGRYPTSFHGMSMSQFCIGAQTFHEIPPHFDEAIERIAFYNAMPISPEHFIPRNVYESPLKDFYLGLITAREAAQELDRRLALWFMEMG